MLKSLVIVLVLSLLCAGLLCLNQPAVHASMIGGLASLPSLTREEVSALPAPAGTIMIRLDGVQLPYDEGSNTYFIPQSAETPHFEGALKLDMLPGYDYFVYPGAALSKKQALSEGIGYHIYGVNGSECVHAKVLFTPLPVLVLQSESGELPKDAAEAGMLTLFETRDGGLQATRSRMDINLRGNTSRRFPKQSYRLSLRQAGGENRNLSIAGLRRDDDWILNPMYSDKTKIREWLAYTLWDDLNRSGLNAQSSRISYAEVFINGQYWGLYGVQERVDRKQVNGDKRSGLLYKVLANDRPTADELLAYEGLDQCRAFKLEYAGSGVTEPWSPAAALIRYLEDGTITPEAILDTGNVIDYGLWVMLTQSHDGFFKNQFLNCVYEDGAYAMYKIPWDTNNTFGDVWSNELEENNHIDFYIGSLVMDSAFERLVTDGDDKIFESIRLRWQELRQSVLEYHALTGRARSMHTALSPAIIRDGRRWPKAGNGSGNAETIRDIESYLFTILFRMDDYIANLGND